ncbi:MAG TPA: nuclear transport factor 2 family protein, partial [Hellea balneolensis]|nr:nuclear transport factor 2 family protein [Hellea balneolensis]
MRILYLILVGTMLLGEAGCASISAQQSDTIKNEITETLAKQDQAWNAGDIDGFMQTYLQSKTLRFASGGKVRRGWQATLDGYKKRYPDKATMGELTFENLEIDVLSKDDALVFGRWALKREHDNPGGLFTLLMRKQNGNWV